MQEMIITFSI